MSNYYKARSSNCNLSSSPHTRRYTPGHSPALTEHPRSIIVRTSSWPGVPLNVTTVGVSSPFGTLLYWYLASKSAYIWESKEGLWRIREAWGLIRGATRTQPYTRTQVHTRRKTGVRWVRRRTHKNVVPPSPLLHCHLEAIRREPRCLGYRLGYIVDGFHCYLRFHDE